MGGVEISGNKSRPIKTSGQPRNYKNNFVVLCLRRDWTLCFFTLQGDLEIWRMKGLDANNPEELFVVRDVPEVFNTFDDLSYTLSCMDLSHFKINAMAQRMFGAL